MKIEENNNSIIEYSQDYIEIIEVKIKENEKKLKNINKEFDKSINTNNKSLLFINSFILIVCSVIFSVIMLNLNIPNWTLLIFEPYLVFLIPISIFLFKKNGQAIRKNYCNKIEETEREIDNYKTDKLLMEKKLKIRNILERILIGNKIDTYDKEVLEQLLNNEENILDSFSLEELNLLNNYIKNSNLREQRLEKTKEKIKEQFILKLDDCNTFDELEEIETIEFQKVFKKNY